MIWGIKGAHQHIHGLAPVLQHQVLGFQLLDLVPGGVASVAQLDDVVLVLIDLLLRGFVPDLELVGPFQEFAQFLDHGREVGVVGQIAAQVRHVGEGTGIKRELQVVRPMMARAEN